MINQERQNELSFRDKLEIGKKVTSYVALTAMVPLRPNIGYQILNPLALFLVSLVMGIISVLFGGIPRSGALTLFAVAFFCGAHYQRRQRWREVENGNAVHGYYIGDSHLNRLRMPGFLKKYRRVERFIDPLLCLLVGVLLMPLLPLLGVWVVFSGVSLRVFEAEVWKMEIEMMMNTVNAALETEVQEEIMEQQTLHIYQPKTGQDNDPAAGYAAEVKKTTVRRTTKRAGGPR